MLKKQTRRDFIEDCSRGTGTILLAGSCSELLAESAPSETGKPFPNWHEGYMDLHFIYTGVGENMFYIFPDGTTILLDSADRISTQEDQFPIKPGKDRLPSEWIARYIKRVAPSSTKIDYMMLSHYHNDHGGSPTLSAGKTTGRGDDYYLSGLANLGEIFQFGKVFDRGYPDYGNTSNITSDDGYLNFRKFTAWKVKNGDFTMEEFKVGKRDQIVLLRKPGAYPAFHIRNLARNGVVWSGKEGQNVDFYERCPNVKRNENAQSIAMTIDYGPFRYYTGGDIGSTFKNSRGEDVHFEGAVGKAAGEVDVCKTNHHSYRDSMSADFTREVRARAYIVNVWDRGHLQDLTMTNMTDPQINTQNAVVCHTWVSEDQKARYRDKPWLKFLKTAYGHIVVRVWDGGKKYKIYHLTAEDESMTVKNVLGPFESKKA